MYFVWDKTFGFNVQCTFFSQICRWRTSNRKTLCSHVLQSNCQWLVTKVRTKNSTDQWPVDHLLNTFSNTFSTVVHWSVISDHWSPDSTRVDHDHKNDQWSVISDTCQWSVRFFNPKIFLSTIHFKKEVLILFNEVLKFWFFLSSARVHPGWGSALTVNSHNKLMPPV